MNILKVKDIYECNVLSFVNNMMKMCPSSFELYFQKRQNSYDVRRKNQLVVPVVRLCLGEKAVRWQVLHGRIDYIKTWCNTDWWNALRVNWRIVTYQNTICDVLIFDLVVLWYSKPSLWNMIAYCIVPTWKTIVLFVMFYPCCPSYFFYFFLFGCQQDELCTPLTTTNG